MFDIVLADGGGGYYYYNPLGTVLPLLGFFILILVLDIFIAPCYLKMIREFAV